MSPRWKATPSRTRWGGVAASDELRLASATEGPDGIELTVQTQTEPCTGATPTVTVPVFSHASNHDWATLPPVKSRQLKRLVAQRRHALRQRQDEVESNLAAPDPEKPNELLEVTVPHEAAEEARRSLEAWDVEPARLTTPIVAAYGLLQRVAPTLDAESGVVVLHVGETLGSIAFLHEGRLRLARAFRMPRLGGAEPGALSDELRSYVVDELSRSLLFFNHELHGQQVGHVLIMSDLHGVDDLVDAARTAIAGSETAELLDALGLGETADPIYALPIALAVSGLRAGNTVNLLPRERRVREAHLRGARMAAVAAAALLVVMSAVQVRVWDEITNAEAALLAAARHLETTDALLDPLEEVLAAREGVQSVERLLDTTNHGFDTAASALRSTSLSVTDSLRVMQFIARADIDPDTGGERMTLRVIGSVGHESGAAAQQSFNRFYDRLTARAPFDDAIVEPITIDTPRDGVSGRVDFEVASEVAG